MQFSINKKNGKKYHIKRLDRTYKILQFLKGISIILNSAQIDNTFFKANQYEIV